MQSILIAQTKAINFKANLAKINLYEIYQGLQAYHTKYRTRRQLASLTEEQLNDIGVSKEQALIESRKAFWK